MIAQRAETSHIGAKIDPRSLRNVFAGTARERRGAVKVRAVVQ
jgi:hypothetical protein